MAIMVGTQKPKLFVGSTKVRKAYLGNVQIYSSGSIVTYVVDSGVSYQEEVDEGLSILNPTSFTPTKAGWTFVGWRQDTIASPTVLPSLVMGENPITLYAVFRHTITLTYYNGSANPSTANGTRYYNNGSVQNPAFTLTPASLSGWSFRGWATSSSATAGITYNTISNTQFTANVTLYAAYSQSITLSYNGNGATGGSTAAESKTRYFNSGNYSNPAFTVKTNGFSRTGYNFLQWRQGSASGTTVAPGSTLTLTASTTLYAEWKQTGPVVITNPVDSFPNRNAVGEGLQNYGMASANKDTLWAGGHSCNDPVEMYITSGVFNVPDGAKKLVVQARATCWGDWTSMLYSGTCICNNKTVTNNQSGGGNPNLGDQTVMTFTFDISGASTANFKIFWKHDDKLEANVWIGIGFISATISF